LDGKRYLVVTADDFGIGPATTRGILDLAAEGLVTCTVLLVNSPHAEESARAWQQSGATLELGWHPCLTLDRPILPPNQVPSLVRPDGSFWPLGAFIRRLWFGRIRPVEMEAELQAQYDRFVALLGHHPTVVNCHHHLQVFPPVGALLRRVLRRGQSPLPYLRQVREPWPMLVRVPGAHRKRALLNVLGRRDAIQQRQAGFPGNEWLVGVTDPPCVADPAYLTRWLSRMPGRVVELTCHPGHWDESLLGRDSTGRDGQLARRVDELARLRCGTFRAACEEAGLTLVSPLDLTRTSARGASHAA
jgi:predicted glycoside hydrolase/deacetylase ChbG (UPF0249 family)